jgi:hypothetical protein
LSLLTPGSWRAGIPHFRNITLIDRHAKAEQTKPLETTPIKSILDKESKEKPFSLETVTKVEKEGGKSRNRMVFGGGWGFPRLTQSPSPPKAEERKTFEFASIKCESLLAISPCIIFVCLLSNRRNTRLYARVNASNPDSKQKG